MKIYLDLLPQEKRQEIKRKKLFRNILSEEILFLVPIIAFVLILLNIYYVLNLRLDTSSSAHPEGQSQDKYQELKIYEEKFKQVNAIDQTLGKIQTGHLYWRNLFQQLSSVAPEGVYISNLSTKNYTVYIVGKAKARDNLLDFKNRLEAAECFQNVNMPLSNLVVKNDVDFQIDLVITQDCLKNQQ